MCWRFEARFVSIWILTFFLHIFSFQNSSGICKMLCFCLNSLCVCDCYAPNVYAHNVYTFSSKLIVVGNVCKFALTWTFISKKGWCAFLYKIFVIFSQAHNIVSSNIFGHTHKQRVLVLYFCVGFILELTGFKFNLCLFDQKVFLFCFFSFISILIPGRKPFL